MFTFVWARSSLQSIASCILFLSLGVLCILELSLFYWKAWIALKWYLCKKMYICVHSIQCNTTTLYGPSNLWPSPPRSFSTHDELRIIPINYLNWLIESNCIEKYRVHCWFRMFYCLYCIIIWSINILPPYILYISWTKDTWFIRFIPA